MRNVDKTRQSYANDGEILRDLNEFLGNKRDPNKKKEKRSCENISKQLFEYGNGVGDVRRQSRDLHDVRRSGESVYSKI